VELLFKLIAERINELALDDSVMNIQFSKEPHSIKGAVAKGRII
jgi:hypothetical protein